MRLDEKKTHNIIKISFRLVIMEAQKIVNIGAKHLGKLDFLLSQYWLMHLSSSRFMKTIKLHQPTSSLTELSRLYLFSTTVGITSYQCHKQLVNFEWRFNGLYKFWSGAWNCIISPVNHNFWGNTHYFFLAQSNDESIKEK